MWLSKEEFKTIELPKLNESEQKYYNEIKQSENGDKTKMMSDVISDVANGNCLFARACVVIEAIIKGGYND